jgi:hypothetical protein
VTDKFGHPVKAPVANPAFPHDGKAPKPFSGEPLPLARSGEGLFNLFIEKLPAWNYGDVLGFVQDLERSAEAPQNQAVILEGLTLMLDRRYPTGSLRRSSILTLVERGLNRVFEAIRKNPGSGYLYHAVDQKAPEPDPNKTLVVDARGFTPEDETSLGRELDRMYEAGFRCFMVIHARGHRFIGNGFGPATEAVWIDV